jgi:serine/threonine protein kinase
MKIIHRDLKPKNILVQKNDNGFVKIKICDFGTSLTFNRGKYKIKLSGLYIILLLKFYRKNIIQNVIFGLAGNKIT